MEELKGSQTERNILTAFAGESQARNRYTYFAEVAREEGFRQIAAIFEETAENERAHARRLFDLLGGGEVNIEASFPAGVVGTTEENLEAAAAGERYEHTEMYPGFAEVAREEGFPPVAAVFEAIAVSEVGHEQRYMELLANLREGQVFEKPDERVWRCRNCGYTFTGKAAPRVCAACTYPRDYFELQANNW
ncbi:MAG: rubrerythrin family protein [Bacillota bacterium]